MTLARHSDPKLTAARYARAQTGTLTTVVNALPTANGSSKGVADRGEPGEQSRAVEETSTPHAPLGVGGVDTTKPLRVQGFEGSREPSGTIRSGEEGIRTLGAELPARRFSKAVLSTTQPPLRQAEY